MTPNPDQSAALTLDVSEQALDDDEKLQVYRSIQEGCANAIRHSETTRRAVSVMAEVERMEIQVLDDGRGVRQEEMDDPKAWGLTGMRERLNALGDRFHSRGSPGRGTTARMSFPIQESLREV